MCICSFTSTNQEMNISLRNGGAKAAAQASRDGNSRNTNIRCINSYYMQMDDAGNKDDSKLMVCLGEGGVGWGLGVNGHSIADVVRRNCEGKVH